MGHPFATLVAPLRYACEKDFAKLPQLRDLRSPLRSAVAAGRAAGIDGRWTEALDRELDHVDSPSAEERKAALVRIVSQLASAGVPLPPELSRLAGSEAPASPPPIFDAREQPPLLAADAPREPEPSRSGRKKAVGLAESKGEAKLLSIAPREGPLATPLRSAGWRMNPRLLTALEKKGVRKMGDVLFLLPRCYEDRRKLRTIAELRPGERGVAVGVVKAAGAVPIRGGRRYFKAVIADHTGSFAATFFHSGPWLSAKFPIGKRLVVSGELRASHSGREMAHPEVEPADDLEELVGPLRPHRPHLPRLRAPRAALLPRAGAPDVRALLAVSGGAAPGGAARAPRPAGAPGGAAAHPLPAGGGGPRAARPPPEPGAPEAGVRRAVLPPARDVAEAAGDRDRARHPLRHRQGRVDRARGRCRSSSPTPRRG